MRLRLRNESQFDWRPRVLVVIMRRGASFRVPPRSLLLLVY